jgi:hypothetical protein
LRQIKDLSQIIEVRRYFMTSISAVVLFTECFAGMITAFYIPSCAFLLMRHGEKARFCSRLRKTMAVVWLFEFDTIALNSNSNSN